MPNVDGWDALLWLAIAVGAYGVWLGFGLAAACIAFGVVVGILALLGSIASGRVPPTPPRET